MNRAERILTLTVASVTLLALAVVVTRPFVDSWAHALLFGLPLFGAMQLFGFWDRRRVRLALEKRHGRLTQRGPVLTFEDSGRISSVHAGSMRALWYQYSVYGWSGANNWMLEFEVDQQRKTLVIYEGPKALLEPLRDWCVRHLPGFDLATFERLAGSLGDDDKADVLVWSRQDPGIQ